MLPSSSCVDDEQRALNPFYGRLIRVNEQARDGRETFAGDDDDGGKHNAFADLVVGNAGMLY